MSQIIYGIFDIFLRQIFLIKSLELALTAGRSARGVSENAQFLNPPKSLGLADSYVACVSTCIQRQSAICAYRPGTAECLAYVDEASDPGKLISRNSGENKIFKIYDRDGSGDQCASNPCANSGLCIDKTDNYSCICTPEFHGKNCENDYRGFRDSCINETIGGIWSVSTSSCFKVYIQSSPSDFQYHLAACQSKAESLGLRGRLANFPTLAVASLATTPDGYYWIGLQSVVVNHTLGRPVAASEWRWFDGSVAVALLDWAQADLDAAMRNDEKLGQHVLYQNSNNKFEVHDSPASGGPYFRGRYCEFLLP